mmetsp:Transcript_38397/g.90634  ORF Transcript_38397/g.90634 Transcript_38397/m.90634 type:complete len:998 (-) Transcript_38397:84-3077(-)
MPDHHIFSAAAWAAMGIGTPEPEPEGEGSSIWPFILLSIIIFLSTIFDCGKELVEHTTPPENAPIVDAFFSELATLGFIGALAFLLTYNFSSSCEGACSIMQQISDHFLGEPDELQEIFEKLHFLLFAVSVVFILVVLVLLRISLKNGKSWKAWESDMNKAHLELAVDVARAESGDNCQIAREKMLQSVMTVQSLMQDKPVATESRWFSSESLWFEWMKPTEQLQAEYYRIRHRFVDDEDEIVETQMDPDFDFCQYLKLTLAHTFAEVIEIKPVDWLVLWLGFAIVFLFYFAEPEWLIWSFLVSELLILLLCVMTQAKLVKIRARLLPAVDVQTTQASIADFSGAIPYPDDETSPLMGSRGISPVPFGDSGNLASITTSSYTGYLPATYRPAQNLPNASGATAEQLMGNAVMDNLLASPPRSPAPGTGPSPPPVNGPKTSISPKPMTSAPPAVPKIPFREKQHPELHHDPSAVHASGGQGSAFEVHVSPRHAGQPPLPSEAGSEQVQPKPSPFDDIPAPRMGTPTQFQSDGLGPRLVSVPVRSALKAEFNTELAPRAKSTDGLDQGPVSLPVARPASASGSVHSMRGRLNSIEVPIMQSVRGKMTQKTKIMLQRPLYTSLPTAASIKYGPHSSPSRLAHGSSKKLVHSPSKRHDDSHGHDAHEEEEGHFSFMGVLRAVFCCCSCLCSSGHHHKIPTKHQALFWFGTRGKGFMIHMVKLLLFSSVISLAVVAVELRIELAETSIFLLVFALLPPALTLFMTPRNLQLLNLVTSIEIMKNEDMIVSVIKEQRFLKQRKITGILSSLQFFIDQTEALQSSTQGAPIKDVAYQFKKLQRDKATKNHLNDLRELFDFYDEDGSGGIEREELGELLAQMGQHKSAEELDRLFKLMDADQSNTVEFEEFAVVIMANRKSKRDMDPIALADRMWKVFDKDGDGSIEVTELSETLKSLGQNWDTADVDRFFQDIDKDGSGAIEKDEFVDFIMENLGGRRGKKKGHH